MLASIKFGKGQTVRDVIPRPGEGVVANGGFT